MKRTFSKLLSLVLIAMLALAMFAGCSNNDNNGSNNGSNNNSSSGEKRDDVIIATANEPPRWRPISTAPSPADI